MLGVGHLCNSLCIEFDRVAVLYKLLLLFIKYGYIDVLAAQIRQLNGFLDEAPLPLAVGDRAACIALDKPRYINLSLSHFRSSLFMRSKYSKIFL